MVGVTDRRYLGVVYANSRTLEQAAQDGDVEISEEIAKKIIKKSFDLLVGNNPIQLDTNTASDVLINEVI